jgi:hypothetical protein
MQHREGPLLCGLLSELLTTVLCFCVYVQCLPPLNVSLVSDMTAAQQHASHAALEHTALVATQQPSPVGRALPISWSQPAMKSSVVSA